jgi:uncharacterized membrane protein (UPF0127 family)
MRLDLLPQRELGESTVYEAKTVRSRTLGLAFMPAPAGGEALWIPRCSAIHTFGMRFALDLVWLDRDEQVVKVDRDVRPARIRYCRQAASVIETVTGGADPFVSQVRVS